MGIPRAPDRRSGAAAPHRRSTDQLPAGAHVQLPFPTSHCGSLQVRHPCGASPRSQSHPPGARRPCDRSGRRPRGVQREIQARANAACRPQLSMPPLRSGQHEQRGMTRGDRGSRLLPSRSSPGSASSGWIALHLSDRRFINQKAIKVTLTAAKCEKFCIGSRCSQGNTGRVEAAHTHPSHPPRPLHPAETRGVPI